MVRLMASSGMSASCFLLVAMFITIFISAPSRVQSIVYGVPKNIPYVKHNKLVQALGSFCVTENNKKRHSHIVFKEVVSGKVQLVAGYNYFLHIQAADGGVTKFFDALVFERPWRHSKTVLSFKPSKP